MAPRKQTDKAPKGEAPKGPPKGMPAFPGEQLGGVVKYSEPLGRHTTFRIGGPAAVHFQPASPEAVAGAVAWAKQHKLPCLILGLGSNVLIRDGGFPGLVIKIGKGLDAVSHRAGTWKVGAGLPIPLLARKSAEEGFGGIHRLIGVPGSVGGGVFMNAGAHGEDFASVLISATLLDPKGKLVEKAKKDIAFSYRHSDLDGHVVLGCALRLEQEEPEKLKSEQSMLLRRRREGTPFDQPCCGSVFKNPEETTAGRLIDRCGLKGRRVGSAEISKVHANYIVNLGNASADDVLKLIDIARTAVFKEFGLELELEVKVLGEGK
jgi:UDP-N-acetylmuramate dehydrogenase